MPSLADIEDTLRKQPRKPPLDAWHPPLSGDIDIRIDSRGDWYHEGTRIQRQPLVNLFASILRREVDDHYYLVTPVEKWRIRVDDAPLLAVDMEIGVDTVDSRRMVFRLNTDELVQLDAAHPLFLAAGPEGDLKPYLKLAQGLSAKLTTAVFYRLVDCAEQRGEELGVTSDREWFSLGKF
jgi:uncharacterized protein